MFNLFKKNSEPDKKNLSLIAIASLLIHSAKIDENFTIKEKKIVRDAFVVGLTEMILFTSNVIISIIYFFVLIVEMIQMLLENNAEYFNT